MQAMVGWARAVAGRHADARAALAELRERPAPAPAVVAEAWLLAALGDVDAAWEVLGRAEDESQLLLLFTGMPGFDPLRNDPRFEQLLRRLGLPPAPQTPAPPRPAPDGPAGVTIAVLPFLNRSDSADDEYFSDGLADELISALSQLPGVRVAGRSSAFRFRGEGLDLRAIGRELGVTAAIEGSVRILGDRLRLTARLLDCATGHQKWSGRFDRQVADIFDTQDEIVRAIVEQLGVTLGGATARPLLTHGAANVEAYRHYLKGRHLRGKEHHAAALRAFEEAVRLDPSHAPSWTGLAEISVLASVFGLIPAREACATARKALATATRLQGESADALHVEAFAAWVERKWVEMETAWRRALELQPTHVLALGSFAISLCSLQRLAEAIPLFDRARQADPLASFPYTLTGLGLLNCGRPHEALRYLEDALSFEKEDATALDGAGMTKVALGSIEEGIATLEHVVAISQRGAHFLGTLGWALAIAGREAEARTILAELRARPPASPTAVSEAWLLGALGDVDAAFAVVARAEEECIAYLYFTGLPAFDPLRTDPRFAALLRRLELAPPGAR
jgi:TolB-like protein/Tfp pilus assembly protein PilF